MAIVFAGLRGAAATSTLVVNNGQASTYPSPDNQKVQQQEVDPARQSFVQGVNTIQIGSAGGRVGVQAVRVAFELPYPQFTFGSQDSPATLTLLEPTPLGSTIGQGQQITFRWSTDNAPSDTYVKLMYQEVDGIWSPVPGVTALPYDVPNGIGNEGIYQTAVPASVATPQFSVQPFVLGLPAGNRDDPTDYDHSYLAVSSHR